jgi:DNA-binding transcriptional LysR family regulator
MYRKPELSLSLLTAFASVARTLHFGQAAEKLGIAQPALSQHIRRVEEIVGYQLLERDTRNVGLTPAGLLLQELAERLPAELAAGLERVRRAGRGEAGRLTIGYTATMALQALPAAVRLHRTRYPDIELELLELLPDALYQMLISGQLDVGLGREFIEHPVLELMQLWREPYVAVIPASLAEVETQRPLAVSRLRDQPFILFASDQSTSHAERVLQLCAESNFAPRTTLSVTSWQSAISLVSVGLGVALLPACTSCLLLPNIVFVPIDSNIASRIDIACRRQDRRPIVGWFIQSVQEAVAGG